MTFIRYPRRALLAVTGMLATCAALAFAAATASADTLEQASSENWAGYIASSSTGSSFSTVSGSWTQPAVTSSSSSTSGYSAFWVGLGGSTGESGSLEQVGTSADWVDGHADYYAWYELLPAAQVKLDLTINAGDRITASVNVNGNTVTLRLADETSGQSATKTESMSNPDTSSAEWIAEAPAAQTQSGDYQTLPLANFGTATFTNASATANGHTGSISDSAWSAQQVNLVATGEAATAYPSDPGFGSGDPAAAAPGGSAAASASSLSSDGTSFSVSVDSSAETTSAQGYPDAGPGFDYGYGYG
jgi:hypothetical protein